jgi:hypothetical protein
MQINSTGFVQVSEKFKKISDILWDNNLQHQTYCVEQDGQQSHIEVEFDLESARVLHDFSWISTDEWNQLIDAKTDYITIY